MKKRIPRKIKKFLKKEQLIKQVEKNNCIDKLFEEVKTAEHIQQYVGE